MKTILKFLKYVRYTEQQISRLDAAVKHLKTTEEKPIITVGPGEQGQASVFKMPFNQEIGLAMVETQRNELGNLLEEFNVALAEMKNQFSITRIESSLCQTTGLEIVKIKSAAGVLIEPDADAEYPEIF